MSREEYMEAVKVAILEDFPERGLDAWDNAGWQRIVNGMYDDFSKYTPEEQHKLIASAGPEEPFWQRVVLDAAFAYFMWT